MKAAFIASSVNPTYEWIRVRYVGTNEGEPLLYKGETKVVDAGDNVHNNVFQNQCRVSGTAVKFKPVIDQPGNTQFSNSWQSITFMEEYMDGKSFEELRLEDCKRSESNRLKPESTTFGGASFGVSLFQQNEPLKFNKTTKCFGGSSNSSRVPNQTRTEEKMEQDGKSSSEAKIQFSTSTASWHNSRHMFPTETPLTPLTCAAMSDPASGHTQRDANEVMTAQRGSKEVMTAQRGSKEVMAAQRELKEEMDAQKERKEAMDALFTTQLKCLQVQQSLHHLLLLKVEQLHADMKTSLSNTSGSATANNERPVTSVKSIHQWPSVRQKLGSTSDDDRKAAQETGVCDGKSGKKKPVDDVAFTSTEELQKPLEALLKCSEIQVALHRRLFAFSIENNSEVTSKVPFSAQSQNHIGVLEEDTDEFLVYAKNQFDTIRFSESLPCSYYRDPFQASRVVASSNDKLYEVQSFNAFSTTAKKPALGSQIRQPHGRGVLVTQSGQILYDGEWRDGKRCGKGKAFIVHGNKLKLNRKKSGYYDGQWKENMRHGQGRMVYLTSAVYEGEWQFDAVEGSGCLLNKDGCSLEGDWTNGTLDGWGIFTWPDGTVEHRDYEFGEVRRLSSQLDLDKAEQLRKKRNIESRLKYTAQSVYEMREQLQQFEKLAEGTRTELVEQLDRAKGLLNDISDEYARKLAEAEKSLCSELKEEVKSLEKQLEEANRARLCQICFENNRDCIIMPCTHMLYCRDCVAKVKQQMNNRCPSCRGPISGEINCNLDLNN